MTNQSDDEILDAHYKNVDRIWSRLAHEVRLMRDASGSQGLAYVKVVEEAIKGDPSMCNLVAFDLALKVGEGETLNAADNFFVFWLLQRIHEDDAVALSLIAGGATGATRGRPRSGAKALAAAAYVIERVMTTDDRTMEQAWESAANEFAISIDMVKRYWTQWKMVALHSAGLEEPVLKAHLAEKRRK